jgi:negative regulator of sigma E activity
MNCNEVRELLSLYIDDELDENEKLLVEQHLQICEECQRELEEYKKIIQALQEIPDEEPPLGYCKRLHDKLLAAEAERTELHETNIKETPAEITEIPRKSKNKMYRWVKYGSVAAAFVLVFLVYGMNNLGMKNSKAEMSYDTAQSNGAEAPAAPAESADFGVMDVRGTSEAEEYKAKEEYQYSLMNVPEIDMKIIKTGSLRVETKDYEKFISDITIEVQNLGGYLENSNSEVYQVFENDDRLMYGNHKIRVPQESFYEFINYIESSSLVKIKNISETDVTKEYSEKDNKVKNLEVQEEHLRTLFDKAQTVEEMLLIENELRRVRTEIDFLNISLKDIDDRAGMSTINLAVDEVLSADFDLASKDNMWDKSKEGFINTVNSIIRTFENLLIYIVSVSPILIPAIIILVIVLVRVKKYLKNRHKI